MKTEIIAILDRSGSMASAKNEAIGGFNVFVEQQRKEPGEARLSLVLFDNEYILLHEGKDVHNVEPLNETTYVPRGATALNDAIGRTLHEQLARITKDAWADRVIVCVVTDGFENSSKEFTQEQARKLVQEMEAKGWSFVWLFSGLTQAQAMATTQGYGVDANKASNVVRSFSGPAGQSLQASYESMASTVSNVRKGKTAKGE